MRSFWFLAFILIILPHFSLGQTENNDSTHEESINFLLSRESKILANYSLKARGALIQLKTHPLIDLNEEQIMKYGKVMDFLQKENDYVEADSITITLKSGISWNLESSPKRPKHFHFKILSKKGRQGKEVQDYLKYLTFVSIWEKYDKIPVEMVEKFNRYYNVTANGMTYIDMFYEIELTTDHSTEITKREITLKDSFIDE